MHTDAANTTLNELRAIPSADFTESVAIALIKAIAGRISASNWGHVQTSLIDAPGAVEFLDDAISVLGDE